MSQRTLSGAPFGDRVGLDSSPGGSRSPGPQMASGDPSFCALPDREASGVLLPASDSRIAETDALLQPWDDLQVYAFPPIVVVRKVLVNWGSRGAAIELSSLRSGLRGNDSLTFWDCY